MSVSRVVATVVVSMSLLTGCVTTQTTSFRAAQGQQTMVRDGRAAVQSARAKTVVVASPATREAPLGSRSSLVVGIRNVSSQPVTFRLADVTAVQTGGKADGAELKVFSYDELVVEERNRQVAAVILAGVAAGANAYGAARSSHNPYVRSWNQQIAARQNADLAASVVAQGEINLTSLEQNIIKDNTLMPGETYGGIIVVAPPSTSESTEASSYRLSMVIAGERHDLDVDQTPVAR